MFQSRPGLGDAVGDVLAVVADRHARERDRAVLGPRVRVEQHPRLAVERVLHVEHALVLQAVVLREEVPAAVLGRRRDLLVVPQVGEALLDRLALGDRFEVTRTVTLFCASTQSATSFDLRTSSSSQRYGSATFVPW